MNIRGPATDVESYKLPARLATVFKRQGQLMGMVSCDEVRLFAKDYRQLNEFIRNKSEKKLSAADMRFRGLPIVPYSEVPNAA